MAQSVTRILKSTEVANLSEIHDSISWLADKQVKNETDGTQEHERTCLNATGSCEHSLVLDGARYESERSNAMLDTAARAHGAEPQTSKAETA